MGIRETVDIGKKGEYVMNGFGQSWRSMVVVGGLVVCAGLVLAGCGQQKPADEHAGHDHGPQAASTAKAHPPEAGGSAAKEEITQKVCPVMGGKINPNLFVEHKGRKVYFCCAGCSDKFEADPDKYLAKLDAATKTP